nr:Uncharacterised protein [Klebsiella pneumoniae]
MSLRINAANLILEVRSDFDDLYFIEIFDDKTFSVQSVDGNVLSKEDMEAAVAGFSRAVLLSESTDDLMSGLHALTNHIVWYQVSGSLQVE